jgi:hypothetical protein
MGSSSESRDKPSEGQIRVGYIMRRANKFGLTNMFGTSYVVSRLIAKASSRSPEDQMLNTLVNLKIGSS